MAKSDTSHVKMIYRFLIILILVVANFASANAKSPWVKITLTNGLSFALPSNWTIIDLSARTTLEAAVVASMSAFKITTELPFAANLIVKGRVSPAYMNIRVYPDETLRQSDVNRLTQAEIALLDGVIKKAILMAVKKSDFTITHWLGTGRKKINGITALVTSYGRSGIKKGSAKSVPRRVTLIRVKDGPKSFTMTVSFSSSGEALLRPIANHIASSLKWTR